MSAPDSSVEVTEVIDSAGYLRLPIGIALVSILIMLIDGYDLQTMSFVAPALVADWHVARADLGWVLNGSLIGMAFGSIGLGRLGDTIGRRNAYVVCLVFLCAGSLLSAHAHNLDQLLAFRVITGIGLGGATPLATTFIAEWAPRRIRSIAVACVVVAVPLGGMLGAMIAKRVMPEFGWRAIFWIGAALPLLFFVLAVTLLPESPKFLAQSPARSRQLAAALNRLLREPRFDGSERFHIAEAAAPSRHWLSVILSRQYLHTTLLLWGAFTFNTVGLYSFANWLPTLLTAAGFSQAAALDELKYFNFGGFFGAVGGAILIGRYGSRIVGTSLALLGVVATLLIGVALTLPSSPAIQLSLLVVVAGAALSGMQSFVYAVGANSYATYVRGAGVGCAQTISRVGGILGGFAAAAFFALRPQPPVGVFFYAVATLGVAVAVSYGLLRTHIRANSSEPGGAQALRVAATQDGA
ncbi:MAG TPA: MFS transporter [Steroidobacteraceae bacterium]|jgi:AAHS family 4-hydroxybenzoate transporter-like MFS transporter